MMTNDQLHALQLVLEVSDDDLHRPAKHILKQAAEAGKELRELRRDQLTAKEYIKGLEQAIREALMHINTNYDVDGGCMKDSDAADCLNRAIGAIK